MQTNRRSADVHHAYFPSQPVEELVASGWHRADLHVHTLCSYDVVKAPWLHPEALYQKARAMRMKYITFTDHDSMRAYDMIGWDREGLVPGVEIKIKDTKAVGHTVHVNVYELNKKQFVELEKIARKTGDIELFLEYLNVNDLPYTFNHPFWSEYGETLNHQVIPFLIELFPVVEYNMHRVRKKNILTLTLADQFLKGVVATTDTHTGDIGRAYTLARGETFREFYDAIRRREAYIVPQDLTVRILSDEIGDWVNLLFHPDVPRPQANMTTGIHHVDRGLDAVMKGHLNQRPRLKSFIETAGRFLSWSRVPALCYLLDQYRGATQIRRQLQASGIAI